MDGLELLQTLNLANMNLTIQAIFQWFQKKVDSLGSRLEAYADGVSENRPNASKWNFRSPAPFTRGYLGFVWRLGSLATHERKFHRFHLQCHAPNQYELVIDSDPTCFLAYKVTVSDTRTERIPIKSPSYPRIQVHGSTTYNPYCKPLMIPTQAASSLLRVCLPGTVER